MKVIQTLNYKTTILLIAIQNCFLLGFLFLTILTNKQSVYNALKGVQRARFLVALFWYCYLASNSSAGLFS